MGKKKHSKNSTSVAKKTTLPTSSPIEKKLNPTTSSEAYSINSSTSGNKSSSNNNTYNTSSDPTPARTNTSSDSTTMSVTDETHTSYSRNSSYHESGGESKSVSTRMTMILDWKEEGNDAFKRKDYSTSLFSYDKALELLRLTDDVHDDNSVDEMTNGAAKVNDLDRHQRRETYVQLLSNRSLVLGKLLRYDESEKDCSYIIETMRVRDQPKVWYRRALSREQIALKLSESDPQCAMDILLLAKSDLQDCLKSTGTTVDNALKVTVTTMAVSIQKSMKHVSEILESVNSASESTMPTMSIIGESSNGSIGNQVQNGDSVQRSVITPRQPILPSTEQQKNDIMQILIGRNLAISNHYRSTVSGNTNKNNMMTTKMQAQVMLGEAFFIINWKWWCHWVLYTGLLQRSRNGVTEQQQSSTTYSIEQYLPVGASIPKYEPPISDKISSDRKKNESKRKVHKRKESDDYSTSSSTTSTSMSVSDNDADDYNGTSHFDTKVPGPIDNTNLLLLPPRSSSISRNAFYKQWYTGSYNQSYSSNLTNGNKRPTDTELDTNAIELNNAIDPEATKCSSVASTILQLRPNLVRGYHYELLPREVYFALRTWYGELSPPICRRVTLSDVSESDNNTSIFELALYPSGKCDVATDNYNETGTLTKVATGCSACRAPGAIRKCNRCKSAWYCDQGCQLSHWPVHKLQCKDAAAVLATNNSNVDPPYDPEVSPFPYSDGRVGLNNLGNTCFMNAAIQCLSHSTPLTRYFLSGLFKSDINQDNPLGTGGKLADAYATVVKDLWWSNDTKKKCSPFQSNVSVSPTALKRAIALFAPRFAGYLQHDTQEFLAYLLDGLHEDMNRIQRPPYVEMPDVSSSMDMSIAAARCWDSYQRRNDSIVLDTFYGQFKSTCVCPTCNKVSVSFDAFNHVSLEIPQPIKPKAEIMPFPVLVYAADEGQTLQYSSIPIKYGVPYQVSTGYRIIHFRQELAQLCQIPASKIVLCEVYKNTIVQILYDDDRKPFADYIQLEIVAYEMQHSFNDASLIHVVASHVFVDPVAAKQTDRAPQDRYPQPDPFGMPFMTSMPDTLTCKEVWDHIWHKVGHLINHVQGSAPDFSERSLLTIRLVDANRRAREMVLRSRESSSDSGMLEGETMDCSTHENYWDTNPQTSEAVPLSRREKCATLNTSILPYDSTEIFKDCLGVFSGDAFVFFSLEWTDPTDEVQSSNVGTNEVVEHYIDEERFLSAVDHSTWIEACQQLNDARKRANTRRNVKLEECFDTFTKPERLDEHNMWYCSNCKAHVRAMKTMQLWKLPNILIIHLKRFEFKQSHGFRREKLDTLVDFPLDGLDMSQHCVSTSSDVSPFVNDTVPAVYDCFAVTNHFGSMGFGHYTAFARRWNEQYGTDDSWALFDDAAVRPVPQPSSIITSAAYVLFYRRRNFS